jgi:hypothetical protein
LEEAAVTAPAGTEVGLYVDLVAQVAIGDIIETRSGRRYGVVSVRVQERGKHAGRQHLRAVVLAEGGLEHSPGAVHRIRWYRRGGGGVRPRGRR